MDRDFPGIDDGRGHLGDRGDHIDSASEPVAIAPIGKIQTAVGLVTIGRSDATPHGASPTVGDFIYEGDAIETGADGLIGIVFIDGTTFHLYANSYVVLDRFNFGADVSSHAARLRASKGKFGLMAGQTAAAGRFVVETPLSKIRSVPPAAGVASLGFMFLLCLIDDLKASSESETLWLVDGGTITYKDFEHGVFELVTKDGQHIIVDDPGQTIILRPAGSGVGVEHISNDRAQIVALQDVYQSAYATFIQGLQDPFLQRLIKTGSDSGSGTLFPNDYNPFSGTQASLYPQIYTPPPNGLPSTNTIVLPPVVPGGVTVGATFTARLPLSNAQTAPVYLGPSNGSHTDNIFLNLTVPSNEVLATVTISGLPAGETITSGTGKIYSGGGSITILGADFYSGLTLSNFSNTAAVLTIVATVFGAGGARLTVTTLALTIDAPIVAQPEAVHWIGPDGGDWDTAGNWSTGAVPIPHQDIFLDKAGTVVSSGTVNISSLAVSAGVTLNITGGSITIPTSAAGKPLANAGVISISAGATMTVGDAAHAGAVVNTDTMLVNGGTLTFVNVAVDNAGATIEVDAASVLNLDGVTISGGAITNNGIVHVTGSSTINGSASLNGGVVNVDAGVTLTLDNITINGTSIVPGASTISANGTFSVQVDASTLADNAQLVLTGSAAFVVTGLVGNLDASAVTGTLTVTTADNTGDNGIAIKTGSNTTAITGVTGTTLDFITVNATALADGTLLTLSGAGNFVVTGLVGNLDASGLTGTLTVTTGDAPDGSIAITTGSGAATIDTGTAASDTVTVHAAAMLQANTLTLSSDSTFVVDGLVGNLNANNTTGSLTALDGLLKITTGDAVDNAIIITTGTASTTIDSGSAASDTINVHAAAMLAASKLTLSGQADFVVDGLIGDLDANNATAPLTALTGDLTVTTASVAALTIATGTGGNTIHAEALTNGQELTLIGSTAVAVFLNAGNLAASAYTGNITITGGVGSSTITTGSGNDSVTLAGAETGGVIDLGTGTDTLNLAAGNNTLSISNVETVNGTASNDSLTLSAAFSDGTIDLKGGSDSLTLGDFTNTLTASNIETITGGTGTGTDTVTLGATQTAGVIDLGAGTDTLNLAAGSNTLSIANVETVNGTASDDTLTLSAAFTGGTIDLKGGTDTLNLAAGNNTLTVSNTETINATALTTGNVLTLGGSDAMTVTHGGGILAAGAYTGDLTVTAGAGGSSITTGSGADFITGDAGNDIITGGGGSDTLTGNAGADSFVFAPNFGNDTIADYTPGTDILQFDSAIFANAAALLAATTDNGSGFAVIAFDANNTITLNDVNTAALQANQGDFHFV